jgi:hypothetical protein
MKATALNKWVSHISPIQSDDELHQFIELWEKLTTINRLEDSEDEIKWRWTIDGQYTTQSAYRIQFVGRHKKPATTPIWKARAEPKCRIFAWILLQHKILTANNLAKRVWPHNPLCQLCNLSAETLTHLCLECPFTQNVWIHLTSQLGRQDLQVFTSHTPNGWWKRLRRSFEKTKAQL